MTISEYQKTLIENASILGDFQSMGKTELANGYCDADEALCLAKAVHNESEIHKQERLRSAYHSALMLRYWYKIFEWQKTSGSLNLDFVDFIDWLYDSLWVAFYYRMWRYEFKADVKHGKFIDWKYDENGERIPNPYYNDVNAPDKIINRCCASMRGRVYQYYNKDKRKTDVQKYSIDQSAEEYGDASYQKAPTLASYDQFNDGVYSIIQSFINDGKIVEALIIDGVVNYDTFKVSKKDAEEAGAVASFNPRALVKHLNTLDNNILSMFSSQYSVPTDDVVSAAKFLQDMSNQKIYKLIEKTLLQIKQSPDLLDCLY